MVEAFGVLLNVDVDGKMSIDVSHLVLVSPGDTGHQVLDDGLDGSEGSDILSRSVVDFDLDDLLALMVLGEGEGDGDVREILGQFAYRETPKDCQSRIPIILFSCACAVLRWGGKTIVLVGHFVPRGPSTVTIRDLM